MKILITDGMDKSAMAQLAAMGHEITEQFFAPEDLGAALREFDAVIIRSATKIRKQQLQVAQGGRLKVIIRAGVGVDNIDVADAEAMGIAVRNTHVNNSLHHKGYQQFKGGLQHLKQRCQNRLFLIIFHKTE